MIQPGPRAFAGRPALRGIDLDVAEGERLVLIGPNGAGKTTLLRILAGLSKPSQGSVRLAGLDLADHGMQTRRQVGFLSHQPLLYRDLSAEENLRFYGRMYDVLCLEERVTILLQQVGLASSRHDLVRTFSGGMQQRLAIARALLHDPPVLLLDEPYASLDHRAAGMLDAILHSAYPVGTPTKEEILRRCAPQNDRMGARTVVLTTHDLERGLRIGNRVAMLIRGQITYQMDNSSADVETFRREYERQTRV